VKTIEFPSRSLTVKEILRHTHLRENLGNTVASNVN
jgi:hypothetical protein